MIKNKSSILLYNWMGKNISIFLFHSFWWRCCCNVRMRSEFRRTNAFVLLFGIWKFPETNSARTATRADALNILRQFRKHAMQQKQETLSKLFYNHGLCMCIATLSTSTETRWRQIRKSAQHFFSSDPVISFDLRKNLWNVSNWTHSDPEYLMRIATEKTRERALGETICIYCKIQTMWTIRDSLAWAMQQIQKKTPVRSVLCAIRMHLCSVHLRVRARRRRHMWCAGCGSGCLVRQMTCSGAGSLPFAVHFIVKLICRTTITCSCERMICAKRQSRRRRQAIRSMWPSCHCECARHVTCIKIHGGCNVNWTQITKSLQWIDTS